MIGRRSGALLLAAAALPALAYLLPPRAILARTAAHRASLEAPALEARGTLELRGAAAAPLAERWPAPGGLLTLPARILVATPGRARLELEPPGAADADRPFAAVRAERLVGGSGLERTPAAAALVRALATLLAAPTDPDGRALGEALGRRGVALDGVALGRCDGRIAWVLGAPGPAPRPLAFIDKESWQPLRLLFDEDGARLDVRLLDWGGPTGGDWFPRAVEVWQGAELLLRFTTGRTTASARLPDALF